ncbi:hypothetical protein BDE02_16G096900 [Populus trichocarpa]|nr:hypothetical protein BDE02_16G096900 [Populus trichocarpa]
MFSLFTTLLNPKHPRAPPPPQRFYPRKWRQQLSFALPTNYSFSPATTLPATSFVFSLPHLTPSPLAPSSAAAVDYSLSLPRHIRAMIVCVVADVSTLTDEVAAKYGFEKVSEEFIGECKSRAVSFKHKKTGAEVMLMMRIKFSALFFALRRHFK